MNLRESGPMQVNMQTSWKLEPCYKLIDSLSPGSDSCPTTAVNFENSATSTVVDPSMHDSVGATTEDNDSVIGLCKYASEVCKKAKQQSGHSTLKVLSL